MTKRIKVAVIGHREGSKRAKAHGIIKQMARAPRPEVLKRIKKLGVTPATAATWYGSMRKARSKITVARAH